MKLSSEESKAAVAAVERAFRATRATEQTPAWLAPIQERALARFVRQGFPTTRNEDWKYTNLADLEKTGGDLLHEPPRAADARAIGALLDRLPRRPGDCTLVFANGRFSAALSVLPAADAGISIATRLDADDAQRARIEEWIDGDASAETPALTALNAAFLIDWLAVDVAAGSELNSAIHVVFATDGKPGGTQPRLLLTAGERSRCRLYEHHIGAAPGWTNAVTHLRCEASAELTYVKLQNENPDARHIAAQYVSVATDSRFRAAHIDLGGRLVRNDLSVQISGRGGLADMHGLFLVDGRRHVDNHTRTDHLVGNTTSRERYHGIMNDRGRGVFNGKIIVHDGADGTDAQLNNRNLLLSKTAEIDTKPELEIYTDDVKCAHGATTGQLDENALFYLRTRGVSMREAKHMLVLAFAHEVLEQFDPDATELIDYINATLERRLPD